MTSYFARNAFCWPKNWHNIHILTRFSIFLFRGVHVLVEGILSNLPFITLYFMAYQQSAIYYFSFHPARRLSVHDSSYFHSCYLLLGGGGGFLYQTFYIEELSLFIESICWIRTSRITMRSAGEKFYLLGVCILGLLGIRKSAF